MMGRLGQVLVVLLVGAIAVVIFAGAGMRAAWDAGWPHANPPTILGRMITKQDRYNWDQASAKVTALLKKRFPVGSSAAEVRLLLTDQGWEQLKECPDRTLHKLENSENYACNENWDQDHAIHYYWGRNPCRHDVVVFWSFDEAGKITFIEGQYSCN